MTAKQRITNEYDYLHNLIRAERARRKMPPKSKDTHRVITGEMLNGIYIAVCSCGFISKDCKTRDEATKTGFDHRVTALRNQKQN